MIEARLPDSCFGYGRQVLSQSLLWSCLVVMSLGLCTPACAVEPVGKAASATAARPTESGPPWKTLRPADQSSLAPLEKVWPTLDASRKDKWLVLARRFPDLSTKERDRIRDRMVEWVAMTPLERGRARQNFQEMQIGRLADRQALWEAYQALPAEQRQELAQRAKPSASVPLSVPRAAGGVPGDGKSAGATKRNFVPANPSATAPRPVSPTVVQVKPGATTTLLTTSASPPVHNQPGLPKIAATDGFVNPSTLLPKRGPQGAAARSAAIQASQPTQQ